MNAKLRIPDLIEKKNNSEKIVALTAYDFTMASIIDRSEVDVVLVGDSLGTVVHGENNTLKVTLDNMVYHTSLVSKAVKRSIVVADLPFMSYQLSPEQALESSGRLVQQGGAEAVKLEGGANIVESVSKIVNAGIPVVGHLGLTPQSFHAMGGYKLQGRKFESALQIESDALELEQSGACAIVLEGMPSDLASKISKKLSIPTIGIGAGIGCDGQILVINDLLGLSAEQSPVFPKFVKNYLNLSESISEAVSGYVKDVKQGEFPSKKHSYSFPKPQLVKKK